MISLTEGPKHGYAIMADIEGMTGRALGPGTLYAAISRLEERGMIESLPAVERRKPYRLTALGESYLVDRLNALDRMVQAGRRRMRENAR